MGTCQSDMTAISSEHKPEHKKDGAGKSAASLIGSAPALSTERGKSGPPDIKEVSLRWLAGTVLTGVTSITLMGGALFAAVDGQDKFAIPSLMKQEIELAASVADEVVNFSVTEKSDRPVQAPPVKSNSNVLHLSTLTRGEDGNHVRTRPFARLDSSLIPREGDPKFEIPTFDPVTIFSGSSQFREKGGDEVLYDSQVDDEIEIRSTPFPLKVENEQTLRGFSDEEVEAQIRRQLPTLRASLEDGTVFARAGAIAYIDPARFEAAPKESASETPFDSLVTIRSENVLTKSKTNNVAHLDLSNGGKLVDLKSARTLADFWKSDMGLSEDADPIITALLQKLPDDGLKSGHKVRMNYAGGPKKNVPDVVSIYDGSQHLFTIARADDGTFVPAAEPKTDARIDGDLNPVPISSGTTSVYRGIYETALKHNIPVELARELIRIYAFDVDFRSPLQATDNMEVFYSLDPQDEKATEESEILYTSLTLGGQKRRYYRFKTTDDNEVDYYDEHGRSAKKFLMRQPVPRAKFRSSFGWRRHPILRTSRLHKGVDWSAARGTPIFAAGNGIVEHAKWYSGYGRWVQIKHANGYETGYAHMNRFAKGIKPGVRVRQGQIIGYVGSTGLSTGPHLHYEVIVNGRHVDPMRIRLPRGRILSGEQLAAFERERNRINQLLQTPDAPKEQNFALNN